MESIKDKITVSLRIMDFNDEDFTRLTPSEKEELDEIIEEVESGNYVSESDIDWE